MHRRAWGWGSRIWACLGLLCLSGCLILDGEVQVTPDDACQVVCECQLFSPGAVRQCTDTCVADGQLAGLSAECLDCVTGASCDGIFGGECNGACAASGGAPESETNP